MMLFFLASDGTITALYPNRMRPSVALAPHTDVVLPFPADGLALTATQPVGHQWVFLVATQRPLALPSVGGITPGHRHTVYPLISGQPTEPAPRLMEWLSQASSDTLGVSLVEFQVVAR